MMIKEKIDFMSKFEFEYKKNLTLNMAKYEFEYNHKKNLNLNMAK
jgi:hypothetical protein